MSHSAVKAAELDLVIFDLDGVLADSSGAHAAAWATLFEEIGLTAVPYDQLAGRPTLDVVRDWTRDLAPSEDQISQWVQQKQTCARQALQHATVTFADTAGAIGRLRAAGLQLSLATGASGATASLLLERAGVADAFDPIVTAEDTTRGKPHPDIYRRVLTHTGVSAERALVVEDSLSGLESARDAGTWYVSVRSGVALHGPRFCGAYPDLDRFVDALFDAPGASSDG